MGRRRIEIRGVHIFSCNAATREKMTLQQKFIEKQPLGGRLYNP